MSSRLSRWRQQRRERMMARAHAEIIAGRIASNPPLAAEHERHAQRMAELGTAVLDDDHSAEVESIGNLLDNSGGMALMVAVAERADAISLQRGGASILRHIEHAWNGIGDWRS